jgi:tetratricopeptide (TPR) repeat protein
MRDTAAKNPSAWVAESILAEVLDEKGNYEEALLHDRRALALRPDDPAMKENVGNMLGKLGRYDEAVLLFRDVLSEQPNRAEAHASLGLALNGLGRYQEAEVHLRKAIELRRLQQVGSVR